MGTALTFEMEMDYPHLGHRFLQVRYAPFRRPGHDHIDRIVTTITDVTASRLAAKKALESERYLRAIIETTAEGFWMVDKNGCFIDANATYCQMIGYTKEELLSLRARDVDPHLTNEEYSRLLGQFTSGKNAIFRTQHQRKDGTIYDVEISATWFPDRECVICFGHDITQQVADEQRLRDNEAWSRAIIDTTAEGFWALDAQGNFIDVNQAYCRMSGYSRDEILNFSIPDIDIEEDHTMVRERITRIKQNGHERLSPITAARTVLCSRWRYPHPGWGLQSGDSSASVMISHRRNRPGRRFSTPQHAQLLSNTCARCCRPGSQPALHVSANVFSSYDVEKIDLIGRHHYDVFPDLPEKWRAIHRQVLAGSVLRNDNDPYQSADGRLMITEWECRPWYQQDGSIGGIILYTEDVTNKRRAESERLLLEAKLRNEQKLSSIGTMASGVAHEINNPLMGIINLAQLVEDRAPVEADSLRDYAREIRSEGERIAGIVSSLLTFSRRDDNSKMEYASPATLLQRVLTLTETLLVRQDIHVHKDIPANLPLILCTQSQIQQILLNLVINARDAVNERFPEASPEKIIEISAGLLQKNGRALVRFSVVDHGQGIPKEIASHIFEPFFTTKPQGFGTGLGLSISYGIARSHGGELPTKTPVWPDCLPSRSPGQSSRQHLIAGTLPHTKSARHPILPTHPRENAPIIFSLCISASLHNHRSVQDSAWVLLSSGKPDLYGILTLGETMRVLVTGSSGFVGSHLVEELVRRKYTVRILLRSGSAPKWLKDLPLETVSAPTRWRCPPESDRQGGYHLPRRRCHQGTDTRRLS